MLLLLQSKLQSEGSGILYVDNLQFKKEQIFGDDDLNSKAFGPLIQDF